MTDTGIAVRYARALYESAREQDILNVAVEDVSTLEHVLQEIPQIADFCRQERDSRSAELELLNLAFFPYVSEMTNNLLRALLRNGRIEVLPHLPAAFHRVEDLHNDIMRVSVEVAREPESDLVEKVEKKLVDRLGSKVEVEWVIKPELIGGIRIGWDNKRIDMSAAHRLRQMKA